MLAEVAVRIAALLFLLNIALVLVVFVRRLLRGARAARERRVRARLEPVIDSLGPRATGADRALLAATVRGLDRRSRPVAATLLLGRLVEAPPEDRAAILRLLREAGAVDVAIRSTEARQAWRRSLASSSLGAAGATEAVPALERRLTDRNHHVREAAAEALGEIGDPAAEPALRELFLTETGVPPGIAYSALVRLGRPAAAAFEQGLASERPTVRTASCFGLAHTAPERAAPALARSLADAAPAVRAAAAEALGAIGGTAAPEPLLAATRDPDPAVRGAAVRALGAYDDPRAVEPVAGVLDDPHREVAQRAGETLVVLARKPGAGRAAAGAVERDGSWAVETARVLAGIGAL